MKLSKVIPAMAIASAAILQSCQPSLKSGIDTANLNQDVRPADDFYQFACGGWIKNNPLPAAYSRYGSFDVLTENNNKRINAILDELRQNSYEEGTIEQKLADLYKGAMDSVRRNEEGVTPVRPYLEEIAAAKDKDELFALRCKYGRMGDQTFMFLYFSADAKNSTQNILSMYQAGLTLGQKEYYLDNDTATTAIRDAYRKHVVNMFRLFGYDNAEQKMEQLLKVETQIASFSRSKTALRDPEANYHKMTMADVEKSYPNLHILDYENAIGVDTKLIPEMVVGQPDFAAGLNALMGSISLDEYKTYMEWDMIHSAAPYLSDEVVAEQFDFFGKTLSGRKENFPRWKRATDQVQSMLGEALGKIYAERFFPASSKERMLKLVENLQTSLAERIKAQDWMDDSTKQAGLDKLSTFLVKIGYPDKWTDFSDLRISAEDSYFANMMKCSEFEHNDNIRKKAGKPVDRSEWYMTPQTVNAYYNPETNEICFPAGILQRPFFDPEADDAFNYGAIGVVIGHEMTHGFDDQGRHYDKDGNMTDWWTAADAANFTERTKRYADFFSSINVLPDLKAKGDLTLGENLADHGGLQVAFNALKNAMAENPLGEADGFTPEQRFFLAYANVWAQNITEQEIRVRTKSDPHALGEWRVNGALPHIDAWYDAFDVKEGDKMFIPKKERLELW